jgi:hypothetical protein
MSTEWEKKLDEGWNHVDIRNAERLLRDDSTEIEQRAYDRRVNVPLAQDLQREQDEENARTAELLAILDSDWNGALSKWGVAPPRNVRQVRSDFVQLPDGRVAHFNDATGCLEFSE